MTAARGQRYVIVTSMTFDKQSKLRRTAVESKSNRSCNHRITEFYNAINSGKYDLNEDEDVPPRSSFSSVRQCMQSTIIYAHGMVGFLYYLTINRKRFGIHVIKASG